MGEQIEAESELVTDDVTDATWYETLVHFLKEVEAHPDVKGATIACVCFRWENITTLCVQYMVEEITGEVVSNDRTVGVLCTAVENALQRLQQTAT